MEPLSLIIGSCSLIIATLAYKHQISKTNTFESLVKTLAEFRNIKYELNEEENHLVNLLANGTLILTQVKQKIQRRLTEIVSLITLIFFSSYADLNELLGSEIEILSNYILGLLSLALAIFGNAKVINQEEKQFLHNMNVLNEIYYKKFVGPAIRQFNEHCDEKTFIQLEERRYNLMLKRLENSLKNKLGNPLPQKPNTFRNIQKEFFDAIDHNNIEKIQLLCANNSGFFALEKVNNKSAVTILQQAVLHGSNYMVKIILDFDCNLNFRNNVGETALHSAARIGSLEKCRLLIDKGADPEIKNISGKLPVACALDAQHQAVADFLANL
ncbi:ankyrin repeat domain-containing protein [Aliikangiella coralliicola]|uniref:Ankyrin repeat domain-containing protein n=1 Tax=Aliikangiella coralliicola TaxID=2592383 RepID=A0A545UG66_9GAMM|nr:ankyrin repeat domain-containing protein [Aliikangiella coralliicola]TQV88461.1 ankyrin repeat domain-containing protein [Aliikangiella coralliicola]